MRKLLPGQWTLKQLKMQELEANPFDDRTVEEKAKELGIAKRTVYVWRERPGWQDAVYDIARRWIGGKAPKVLRSLVHKANTGDAQAIKLYLEVIGRYTQKTEMDIRAGRLEEFTDDELRNIVEEGATSKGGGSAGATKTLPREPDLVLPPPQITGPVS
jgi:hypothetical protein